MQKVILYQYYFRQLRYCLRYVSDIAMKSTNTPYSHERKVKHVYKKKKAYWFMSKYEAGANHARLPARHVTSLYRTNIKTNYCSSL